VFKTQFCENKSELHDKVTLIFFYSVAETSLHKFKYLSSRVKS